jgi:hypothetical protein
MFWFYSSQRQDSGTIGQNPPVARQDYGSSRDFHASVMAFRLHFGKVMHPAIAEIP